MTTNTSSLHVQNILSTLVIHVCSAHKFGLLISQNWIQKIQIVNMANYQTCHVYL